MRQQRRVGGDHDDDRAGRRAASSTHGRPLACCRGSPGRPARRRRAAARRRPKLACTSTPDRVAAVLGSSSRDDGADAALEAVADHAGAAADVALGHRPALGAVERLEDVRLLDVEAVDVVEVAVVGLGHDRQRPPVARARRAWPLLTRQAMTASRTTPTLWVLVISTGPSRKPDSSTQVGAGHLAVAVEREPAGEDGWSCESLAARQDRGDAGADRALADRRACPRRR